MKRTIKIYLYTVGVVLRIAPGYGLLSILDSILHSVTILSYNLILLGLLADMVVQGTQFVTALPYILIVAAIMLASMVVRNIKKEYFAAKAENRVAEHINGILFDKSLSCDIACYERSEFYEDFYITVEHSDKKVFEIFEESIRIISLLITLVGTTAILWSISFVYIIFCIGALLINGIAQVARNRSRYSYDIEMTRRRKRSDYFGRLFYLPEYIKELKINNLSERYETKSRANFDDMLGLTRKFGWRIAFHGWVSDFIANSLLIDGLLLAKLSYDALVLKTLSLGNVITILRGLSNFQWIVGDLIDAFGNMAVNAKYIIRLQTFLETPSSLASGELIPTFTSSSVLELKDVSFQYSPDSKKVLDRVNMRICLGEKAALVGLNGAGKSTLFKLLLRFYDPTEGGIFLDGTDIKSFDIHQYRRLFSGVFQDFNIYCASFAQNIAMDSDYNLQKVAGAGAQIGLDAVLQRHGISYESRLGLMV